MKKNHFILLILFAFSVSFSQEESKDYDFDPKVILAISPLSLIDLYDSPSIRYGADIKLFKRLSCSIEAGNYILQQKKGLKINAKGYLFKPEIKYRIAENDDNTQHLGLEYQYKQQSYDFKDSIATSDGNIEKQYSMKRRMNCLSLKYSFVQELGKKFTFTYYFGLGVRFLISSNNLTPEENKAILDDELHGGTQIQTPIRETGNLTRINVLAGIKLGYILF